MPTVTLLQKLYASIPLKMAESEIQASCEGLDATVKATGTTSQGWLRLTISGEDEVAALNLLRKEFGIAPDNVKNIKEGNTYSGKIAPSGKSDMEIHIDIGVFLPRPMIATISIQHLQSQLADGKRLSLQRLRQVFCLIDNFPMEILIKHVHSKQGILTAELGEKQILLISNWETSNLDRLVVVGAFLKTIENALTNSGHSRDIAEIENLGAFEHLVVCKLGTNAVGLIPRLGRLIPDAVFGVFSPTEISRLVKA